MGGRARMPVAAAGTPRAAVRSRRRPPKEEKRELRLWRRKHTWHPNRIRHSRATEIQRSHGIEAAQAALGHSSLDMTQVYIDKNVEALIRLADRHYIIEKGRIAWSGTSPDLAGNTELQHRYLGV